MKIDLTLHDMERLIAGYKLEESEICERYSKFKESRDLDDHSVNTLDDIMKEHLVEVRSRIAYFLELFEKRNACMNALNSIYGINIGEEQVPYIIENLLKELKSKQKGDNHEIDITPNELKMLINDYELKIAMAKIEFYGNSHRGPIIKAGSSITEMNSRLEHLKDMYEASLDNVRRFYQLKGINGARDFCTYYDGMSMRDAAELIEEFESRKES